MRKVIPFVAERMPLHLAADRAGAHGNCGFFGRQFLTHPTFIILLKSLDFYYLNLTSQNS